MLLALLAVVVDPQDVTDEFLVAKPENKSAIEHMADQSNVRISLTNLRRVCVKDGVDILQKHIS